MKKTMKMMMIIKILATKKTRMMKMIGMRMRKRMRTEMAEIVPVCILQIKRAIPNSWNRPTKLLATTYSPIPSPV